MEFLLKTPLASPKTLVSIVILNYLNGIIMSQNHTIASCC